MNAAGHFPLDHVGILVEDFGVIGRLAAQLGLTLREPQPEPELGIEILWADGGGTPLEFIRSLREDSRVAAALRAGEGGIHHVAFAVEVLDEILQALASEGVRARGGDPRDGSRGSRIAFLEPATTAGCRIELVEYR